MSKKNNFSLPVNALTKSYRTKFNMDHTVKGTFNHGELIDFDVIECLPGDTFKIAQQYDQQLALEATVLITHQ